MKKEYTLVDKAGYYNGVVESAIDKCCKNCTSVNKLDKKQCECGENRYCKIVEDEIMGKIFNL